MFLPFLDRADELRVLKRVLQSQEPVAAILYGRRRCGKSRLLQQAIKPGVIYYLADQSDRTLQIEALAKQAAEQFPGFDAATYHSWQAIFEAINGRVSSRKKGPTSIIFDEFPYLVSEYPALPSLLQKHIDTHTLKVNIILCGSSQRMMNGLVLNDTAPLYGRAREIVKIRPLKAGWITNALGVTGAEAVLHYALWGGVPRYWELAAEFSDHTKAIEELVFNRDGILHSEPRRLLLDDMRTDTQPHSILAVIGSGVHRISEISARFGKPAMNILRPLEILIELGLVRREVPFGEHEKNTKRTLYTIADPFLRFWYRYVYPNLSLLEQERYSVVLEQWEKTRDSFIGGIWEDLARESVPYLSIDGKKWKSAYRWWGKNKPEGMSEIDIVAESADGTALLIGEAKWGDMDMEACSFKLQMAIDKLPFVKGKEIKTAFWCGKPRFSKTRVSVITPEMVIEALR